MHTKTSHLAGSALAAAALLATTLAGCGNVPSKDAAGSSSQAPSSGASSAGASTSSQPSSSSSSPTVPAVTLTPSVADGAKGVKVSTIVSVKAHAGTLSQVKLWTKAKSSSGATKTVKVSGAISGAGTTWTAADALDPGSKYRLEMVGKNTANAVTQVKSSFTTQKLSLTKQTFPSFQPAKGSTVGVGMPVILTFDLPVHNRKEFQKHLSVTSTGHQAGTWHWYSDTIVHFRPKEFWNPGTKVTATADLNGVSAGQGVFGQSSASTSFTVGRSLITKINLGSHMAKVYINGQLARSIPISAGKPGWTTRSGTKLIMQKLVVTRMTNAMIGAKESYDFQVPFAMRVTTSGEFLHAAPWKEGKGQFGHRNTSHGCVGMSTSDARWLFHRVHLGDPVVTTGSHKHLEQGNGWSDWNISYAKYLKGSAI